ncbi:MAG TPA: hypothetical protein VFV83_03090 [Chthoniobacteraceae bacterium]|nr:hypothetical protein [Chthoniobacteraceae bacterium]
MNTDPGKEGANSAVILSGVSGGQAGPKRSRRIPMNYQRRRLRSLYVIGSKSEASRVA